MFALHKCQAHEDCFSGYLRLLTELYFRLVPGIVLKYVTLRKKHLWIWTLDSSC